MSVSTLELIASATQTASGNGAWIPVQTLTMLQVEVDITAATSITTFDLWLQGSAVGGADEGYDLPCDRQLTTLATAAGNAPVADLRDIVQNKTTSTAQRDIGIFKHVPAKYVRVKWILSGTDVTFSVKGSGK